MKLTVDDFGAQIESDKILQESVVALLSLKLSPQRKMYLGAVVAVTPHEQTSGMVTTVTPVLHVVPARSWTHGLQRLFCV